MPNQQTADVTTNALRTSSLLGLTYDVRARHSLLCNSCVTSYECMSDDIAESGPISLLDTCTQRVARLLLENTLPQSHGTAMDLQIDLLHTSKSQMAPHRIQFPGCCAVQELPGPDIACKVSEAIERC